MTDPDPDAVDLGAPPAARLVTTEREDTPAVVVVRPLPWWQMVGVRVIRTYLQSLAGLTVAVLVVPPTIGATPPTYVLDPIVGAFLVAAQYALAPALAALIHNLIEILTRLDVNQPGLRA